MLSSLLLMAAAVAAGVATYLFWLPCRGSMLQGSMLLPVNSGFDSGSPGP